MKTALLLAVSVAAVVRAADPALTIYNQNFAVVRDTVPLDLKAGVNEVRFAGTTAQVEPDSVILRDPAGKTPFRVLEQNYRNDPVSQELLLSLFEGKTIEFLRHEDEKADVIVSGKIVRSGYVPSEQRVEPIIEVGGTLQFSLPGEPRFPSLGDGTQLKPALTWKLETAAPAKLDAELAYVTGGFGWNASYNVIAPEKSDALELVGWITIRNTSGATFTNAKVKLMAGDVNKVTGESHRGQLVARMAPEDVPQVTEKSFDEFHLYNLARPTTLLDKETKQVEFTRAAGVKATRLYVFDGADIPWRLGMLVGEDPEYGTRSKKIVAVYREFQNSEANKLGIPLPKGRIRFYQQDADGQLEFTGEAEIDHTPKGEIVRVYVGNSFDLVGERRRTDFQVDADNHRASESFEVKVRNRKKEPVEIRVVEHLYRWTNWQIEKPSQPFEKKDAQTIEFKVPVKPDEEKTVTYTAKYSW